MPVMCLDAPLPVPSLSSPSAAQTAIQPPSTGPACSVRQRQVPHAGQRVGMELVNTALAMS